MPKIHNIKDHTKEGGKFSENHEMRENKLKIKTDVNIWLRSCEQEILDPIEGVVKGKIPEWINGTLMRNGPGKFQYGNDTYKHLFDCSALLHRFNISNGKMTYQNKFLNSESYKKNMAANRIVVSEMGTVALPDACQSIFSRFVYFYSFHSTMEICKHV